MSKGILVIRGGGIGDFILTLPAIDLLRKSFPSSPLELLGYRRVLGLVEGRYYADSVRSIDYGPMAACFNPAARMSDELAAYFLSFAQIVSYIYDPDELFKHSLSKIGVKNIVAASPKVGAGAHAARQLASPLSALGLSLDDPAARVYPSENDFAQAEALLSPMDEPFIAVHPGSGSASKNWPLAYWQSLIGSLLQKGLRYRVLIVGGEADDARMDSLHRIFGARVSWIRSTPLEVVAATLAQAALFIGHDSGISHLAAASGVHCLLLFGPTEPTIWAPANPSVLVMQAPSKSLVDIDPGNVLLATRKLLEDA